jgi:ribosomal protein S18 acetylase RimI-like enzyme
MARDSQTTDVPAPALCLRALGSTDQARLWHWLHVALWDPPPAPPRPLEILDEPRVRIYAESWGRAGDIGVVGELGNIPVGACWMRLLPEGVGLASIDATTPQLGIALEPPHQHRGFGRILMRGALAAAQAHGYDLVSLTVHPLNPAIRLYARCGFVDAGERNGYRLMVATL